MLRRLIGLPEPLRLVTMLLLLLVIGGVYSLLRYRETQEVPALFADLPVALQPESFPQMSIAKRWRWVSLDPGGLDQLREVGARFELNLFPDMEIYDTRDNVNNLFVRMRVRHLFIIWTQAMQTHGRPFTGE